MQRDSDRKAILESGVTSMHSLPLRTTGQLFLLYLMLVPLSTQNSPRTPRTIPAYTSSACTGVRVVGSAIGLGHVRGGHSRRRRRTLSLLTIATLVEKVLARSLCEVHAHTADPHLVSLSAIAGWRGISWRIGCDKRRRKSTQRKPCVGERNEGNETKRNEAAKARKPQGRKEMETVLVLKSQRRKWNASAEDCGGAGLSCRGSNRHRLDGSANRKAAIILQPLVLAIPFFESSERKIHTAYF